MGKSKKNKLIRLIAFVCAILLLSASVIVIFAEFTKSLRVRRVISSSDSEIALFSSNYLSLINNDNLNKRIQYVDSVSQGSNFDITICNYAQGNPTDVYEREIKYDLVARLVRVSGNTRTIINNGNDVDADLSVDISFEGSVITLSKNQLSYTFNNLGNHYSLPGLVSTTKIIKVDFDSSFNEETEIYLEIDAQLYPSSSAYLGIYDLNAYFNPMISSHSEVNSWSGEFNEREAITPDNLDGFNYVISGNGVGTITLRWDTRYVEMNQQFLTKYASIFNKDEHDNYIFIDGNTKYVSFDVDSSDIDRYDLQFYKTSLISSNYSTWNTVNSYITCRFDES